MEQQQRGSSSRYSDSQSSDASEIPAAAEQPPLSRRHSEVGDVSSKAAVKVESEAVVSASPAEVPPILPSITESGLSLSLSLSLSLRLCLRLRLSLSLSLSRC